MSIYHINQSHKISSSEGFLGDNFHGITNPAFEMDFVVKGNMSGPKCICTSLPYLVMLI